jgi:parvulin-like peptidyl-prolyl isomerase
MVHLYRTGIFLFVFGCASPALSQQRQAIVNGKPVTEAELTAVLKLAPAELSAVLSKKPDELLRYYGLVDRLAGLAEKANLAAESPFKEQLELARKQLLATAISDRYFTDHPVTPEEEQQFYSAHKDGYTSALVKGICVPIESAAKAAEASAKAEELAKQIGTPADFDGMAAKYPIRDFSNTIGKADAKIPEAVRSAVFGLKPGSHTSPIVLPSGVYILRLESLTVKPLAEVRGDVVQQLSAERFFAWMAEVRKSVTVEYSPH